MIDTGLTILAIILLINAAWLLFMGGYADRTGMGRTKTYEFATTPYRYSFSVGLILALALLCLYIPHPNYLTLAIAKVPQLKFLFTVAKMKNGTIYLFLICTAAGTVMAYLFRQTLLTLTTFTKGDELDMHRNVKKAYATKMTAEEEDFQRKYGTLKERFEEEVEKEEQ